MINIFKTELKKHQKLPAMIGVGKVPFQKYVDNYRELLKIIYRSKYIDCFGSVHYDILKFNKLFFDLDNANLKKAMEDTRLLYDFFVEKGTYPRVYFSGSKGFHMYIDFPETEIHDYSERIDWFMTLCMNEFPSIDSFDKRVCKDVKRISRLPLTINSKTGKQCIPIDLEKSTLENMVRIPIVKKPSKKFIDIYMSLKVEREEVDYKSVRFNYSNELSYILDNAYKITDGRMNLIWKIIIPSLIHLDKSDTEIRNILKDYAINCNLGWNNSIKTFVNYYITRTRKQGWRPISIERFKRDYQLRGI